MKNNKILIIAFKFPPYSEIGSKRWAKFSKYLSKKGYKIHVITVNWEQQSKNLWNKDIENNPNIIIHRIKSNFCHNLKYKKFDSNSLDGKIKILCRHLIISLLNKVYYEDEAQFWGKYLLPYSKNLIRKEKIVNVIATGSPFMTNYWAAKLKQEMPSINLIQDFRDPWTDFPSKKYSSKKIEKSIKSMEKFSLNHCDYIISPAEGLNKILKKKVYNKNIKFKEIENGLENQENIKSNPLDDKLTMTYAGSISYGREKGFLNLLTAIDQLSKENLFFATNFRLRVYTIIPHELIKNFKSLVCQGILELNEYVSEIEIKKRLTESHLLLLINADGFTYGYSSKIFDYINAEKFIFCITPEGDLNNRINKFKIGLTFRSYDIMNMKRKLEVIHKKWQKNKKILECNNHNLIKKFSYENITVELIKCFR